MPLEELKKWAIYCEARPFGWREDNRTAMLLSAQGVKKPADQLFPSIRLMQKWADKQEDSHKMRQSLRSSLFGAMFEKNGIK